MRTGLAALGVLGVLALMGLSFAVGLVAGGPSPSPTSMPSPTVVAPSPTASASPGPSPTVQPSPTLEPGIHGSAVVLPQRSAEIVSPITTTVQAVFVRQGTAVREGQLLVRLDTSARMAAVNLAEAELRRAQAAVARAQVALELLPDDATSEQRETLEVELQLAEADEGVAQASLEAAREALAQTEIRAPFAGTVAELAVEAGDQAITGRPLVTVADMSGWIFETTDITELDVVRVAVGDRVVLTVPALPNLSLDGVVQQVRVRGGANGGSVLFDVVIRPLEHRPELRWNMSANVRILPAR